MVLRGGSAGPMPEVVDMIQSRCWKTSTESNSRLVSVVHVVAMDAWDTMPVTTFRPSLNVMNPEPLSPGQRDAVDDLAVKKLPPGRSEERRVGKECRCRCGGVD